MGAIINRLKPQGRRWELIFGVVIALAILGRFGSSAEGQGSLLDYWLSDYVEEKAIAWEIPHRMTNLQLADINSIFAGSGGDASLTPAPSNDAVTVHDSALVALTPPDGNYLEGIVNQRNGITEYIVQEGDLLSFIASDYGVSLQTLVWANGLRDADAIAPGQTLRIPPVSGVVHKIAKGDTVTSIAKKYSAEDVRIIAYNRLPQDGALEVGRELIIPDGRMSSPVAPATVGTSSVARIVQAAKQFAHLPDLGEYFKVPTFGYNWGRIHGRNGVDIANSCGTAIFAAADGTVAVADDSGYNGGFGKYLKLAHSNGTETLYAHASKLLVEEGQVVAKGDRVALMGTTGRSTGCHLHFEVHGAQNPLAKN